MWNRQVIDITAFAAKSVAVWNNKSIMSKCVNAQSAAQEMCAITCNAYLNKHRDTTLCLVLKWFSDTIEKSAPRHMSSSSTHP
jgi:hypothetical protein